MSASMKGRVISEEQRKKISASLVGNSRSKGKKRGPHSTETRRKIGEANRGSKATQDLRDRMSAQRRTPVRCVDTGEIFDCALSAAMHFGGTHKTLVWQCCAGVRQSAYGRRFEYVGRVHG
jgi:hypothetical protein